MSEASGPSDQQPNFEAKAARQQLPVDIVNGHLHHAPEGVMLTHKERPGFGDVELGYSRRGKPNVVDGLVDPNQATHYRVFLGDSRLSIPITHPDYVGHVEGMNMRLEGESANPAVLAEEVVGQVNAAGTLPPESIKEILLAEKSNYRERFEREIVDEQWRVWKEANGIEGPDTSEPEELPGVIVIESEGQMGLQGLMRRVGERIREEQYRQEVGFVPQPVSEAEFVAQAEGFIATQQAIYDRKIQWLDEQP